MTHFAAEGQCKRLATGHSAAPENARVNRGVNSMAVTVMIEMVTDGRRAQWHRNWV